MFDKLSNRKDEEWMKFKVEKRYIKPPIKTIIDKAEEVIPYGYYCTGDGAKCSNVGITGNYYTDDDIKRDKRFPELSIEDDEIKNIIHKLNEKYSQLGIESFEKEDGFNQFEVQFQQTNDALTICKQICDFRNVMTELCNVDFRAKPDLNDAGSS